MASQSYLEVLVKTWKPDNHGLFDFLAYDINRNSFKIRSPCTIFRQGSKCYIPNPNILEHSAPVISVSKLRECFHISLDNEEHDLVMWKIVKFSKKYPQGPKLIEGDWLKLGKVLLYVKQVGEASGDINSKLVDSFYPGRNKNIHEEAGEIQSFSSYNSGCNISENLEEKRENQEINGALIEVFQKEESNNDKNSEKRLEIDIKEEEQRKTKLKKRKNAEDAYSCRICLCESYSSDDPLVVPCKCSGTVSRVHIKCLQKWLKSRIQSHITSKTISVYLKDLLCELCKSELPYKITFRSRDYLLIKLPIQTLSSFVLFEEFSFDRKHILAVHLISLNESQSATIGRANYSDLKISDLTVSRTHCKIRMMNDDFFIADRESKFGTLVEMSREVKVKEREIYVQVGRCVLKICEKIPFDCCRLCRKTNRVDVDKTAGKTQTDGFECNGEATGFLVNRISVDRVE